MTVKAYLYDKQKTLTADAKSAVLAKLEEIMAQAEARLYGGQLAYAYAA